MKNALKYLLFANYVSILGTWLLGPIYASFLLEIGGSTLHAGASWGCMAIISAVVMFLSGSRIDAARHREKYLAMGYGLLSLSTALYIFVESVPSLYLVQVIAGVGFGLLTPTWKAVYAEYEDKGKEVQEWGIADGGNQLITGVGSIAGGAIVSALSFTALFLVMTAAQVIATGIATKFYYAQR